LVQLLSFCEKTTSPPPPLVEPTASLWMLHYSHIFKAAMIWYQFEWKNWCWFYFLKLKLLNWKILFVCISSTNVYIISSHFFCFNFLWFYPLMLFYFIYEFNIWNALLVLSKLAFTFVLFSFVCWWKSLPIDLASA
jgi:hypothetical protein